MTPLWTNAGDVDSPRTWATLQTFDSGTWVSLPLSGGIAADDAVVPNFNATLDTVATRNPFMRVTDTGSGTGTGAHLDICLPAAGLGGNGAVTLPSVVGNVILLGTSETATVGSKTFSGTGNIIRCGATHTRFSNATSLTQYANFDMGSLTAARLFAFPNMPGVILLAESIVTDRDAVTGDVGVVTYEDDVVSLLGT